MKHHLACYVWNLEALTINTVLGLQCTMHSIIRRICKTSDLQRLLLFFMGHQEALCNRVTVEFTDDQLAPHTHSRVLILSLRVSPHKKMVKALKSCDLKLRFAMV